MVGSLTSGTRSSGRDRRQRRARPLPSARINRLSELFVERAQRLTVDGLRILEAALQDKSAGPEQIVDALDAADTEAIELTGDGIGETVSRKEGLSRLDAVTVDDESTEWARSELLGVGEVADRLGLGRSTIDNWRRSRKVVAFSHGVRNFVFPAAQFEGARPLPGLDRIRDALGTPEAAWEWLVSANTVTGGEQPLKWLRGGRVDEVVRAAEGTLDYA